MSLSPNLVCFAIYQPIISTSEDNTDTYCEIYPLGPLSLKSLELQSCAPLQGLFNRLFFFLSFFSHFLFACIQFLKFRTSLKEEGMAASPFNFAQTVKEYKSKVSFDLGLRSGIISSCQTGGLLGSLIESNPEELTKKQIYFHFLSNG